MKKIWKVVALGAVLVLAACGSTNSNGSINGNWSAALMSQSNSNSPVFNFSLNLAQTSGGGLSITNLNFTSGGTCFAGGATATGGFALSGNFNGQTSGSLQMNIQSNSGSNQLTLQGTVNNNTVTGNWTLTGTTAGCTGQGTFTMNKS
jgi:hypothetical protein